MVNRIPPVAMLCLMPFFTGCPWLTSFQPYWARQGAEHPLVYQKPPTSGEIVAAINTHSNRIQDIQGNGRLSVRGLVSLSAELAMQPHDQRSRLRAEFMGMTGTEVDIGSNPELFWVWVKRAQPPGVYYARHDEFSSSEAGRMIPIQPKWLTEAFGILKLDPYKTYEGPFTAENNHLELRWLEHGHNDTIERRIIVHKDYGYILKQEWRRGGSLIASATASNFEYWSEEQVSLPHQLEVNVPEAEMNMVLEMDRYSINHPMGDPDRLYQPPNPQGVPKINVANPRFNPAAPAGSPANAPVSPNQQAYGQPTQPQPYANSGLNYQNNQNHPYSQTQNGYASGSPTRGYNAAADRSVANNPTDQNRSSYWQNAGSDPAAGNHYGSNNGAISSDLDRSFDPSNWPNTSQPDYRTASQPQTPPPMQTPVQIGDGGSFSPPTAGDHRPPLRGFSNWR